MTDDRTSTEEVVSRLAARLTVDASSPDCISNAIRSVREFLGMDVAFVSAFGTSERTLTHVDAATGKPPFAAGHVIPMSRGYCEKVVSGELPALIPDTSLNAITRAMPETALIGIGSHISAPITLSDGSVYGTFCCYSAGPDPFLDGRDIQILRAVADLVSFHIETGAASARKHEETWSRIAEAIDAGQPSVLYQPVVDLKTGRVVGAEALGRFSAKPLMSPDIWFNQAGDVGLRSELETSAIRNAVTGFRPLLDKGDLYLAVNVGPVLSMEGYLRTLFEGFPLDRLVIEITEHDIVKDYDLLSQSLMALRAGGVRIAADDVGAGYANMRHVLRLSPDYMKLDAAVTSAVHEDRSQEALVAGMMEFSRRSECLIVAEGIESAPQLECLKSMGVQFGQGYHLGQPGTVEQLEDRAT